jgi:8-oxo-dGTP pyrophosphatase MutT (NUDIX family)
MPHPSPSRFNLRYVTRSRSTVDETSAGGLVVRRSGGDLHVALIARYDRRRRLVWSLPKGHVEEGETVEEAALREVYEETGLTAQIVAPLGIIDFWFAVEDKRIHKTVHHFLMRYESGEINDEDIEVVEVEWVPFDEVSSRLAYRDERRLVAKARGMLGDI